MPEIKINVVNRVAKADKDAVIVCGNSDYAVVFNFDEEWVGGSVKTALFAYNGGVVPVVFTGSVCVAPVIEGTTAVGIGVASGNLVEGETPKLQTTTAAFVPCLLSIKDESGDYVAPPSPAVYDEIIALLNKYIQQGGGGGSGGTDEERVREIAGEIVDDKIAAEIPTWAKEPTKPSYTAEEVGALPSDTPLFSGDYNDLTNKPEGLASEEYVNQKADVLSAEITAINTVLEQSGLITKYKPTIEDTYNERITAGGLNVLDGSLAKLEKVVGSTVKCNNLIDIPENFTWTVIYEKRKFELPAGTYTISCSSYEQGGAAPPHIRFLGVNNSDDIWTRVDKAYTKSFAGGEYTVYFYSADNAGSSGGITSTINKLMLNEGSSALPYQPYFEGLKNASFAGIESTGRNLINQDLLLEGTGASRAVFEGFDCIKLTAGTTVIPFSCKANANVRLSVDLAWENGVDTYWFFKYADGTISSKSLLSASISGGRGFNRYSQPIVIPEKDVVGIEARRYGGNNIVYLKDLMLNHGTTALPYEPYIEPTVFNFPKTELGEWDKLDFENQNVVRGTKTIVFDGTENWEFLNSYISLRNVPSIANANNGICNLYPYLYQFAGKCIFVAGSYLRVGTALGETFNNDVAKWKAHLAELYASGKPLVIAYELATPTETQFTNGNEYEAWANGTERVLGNDNAEFGVKNTLSQNYIIVTGVK